ncbi:MAG: hypothetical protein NXI04_23105 [Planctomycetaceae bacterium]|nr:hypothetical protein [Planctomycetaceae bacterium]
MLLQFPNSETLVLAISGGTVPEDVCATAAQAAVAQDGSIWVEFEGRLSRTSVRQLRDWGTTVRRGRGKLADQFTECVSWLQLVPLQKEKGLTSVSDRGQAIFQLHDESLLPELVNEILRQGNDRQSYRKITGDDSCVLLRVIGVPYYSLLRATEQWAQGRMTAFIERAPRVWIEAGYQHPLAARISPHAGEHLLIDKTQRWQNLTERPFEDIYRQSEFLLPAAAEPMADATTLPTLQVPIRLTRSTGQEAAEIYVLTDSACAQMDQFVRASSDAVLERLAFAITESDDQSPTIIVRIRPGRGTPPVLVFDALACRSFLKIPNLFVPVGNRIHPPLRRDAVRDLLAEDESRLIWLAPVTDGSSDAAVETTRAFVVRSVEDSAFLPLTSWVDYVLERDAETLTTWRLAHQFDFEDFVCKEERKQTKKKPVARPEPDRTPAGTTASSGKTPRKSAVKKLIDRFRGSAAQPPEDEEIVQLKAELSAVESRFLAMEAPLEDPQRLPLWDQMADLNAALGRSADSSICRQHRLWDDDHPDDHNWALWFETDVQAAHRLGAATLCSSEGQVTARELRRILKSTAPAPSEVAQLASWIAWSASTDSDIELLQQSLAAVQQHLEKYEASLAVRSCWLAWLALARISDDVLLLARARDRLLDRIYQHGLTADRDLPSFLRSGGSHAGDRFRQVREKVKDLHATIRAWSVANQGMASPKTKQYIDLIMAFAFARLGEQSLAAELLHSAEQDLLDKPDFVHHWLYDAYRYRIEAVLAGRPADGPFPESLLTRLEQIERIDRYKVDRLRQHSSILEPVEKLNPYHKWISRDDESLATRLGNLFSVSSRSELADRLQAILGEKLSTDDRARAVTIGLELSTRLGEQFAAGLLSEVVPLDRKLKDPVARANLLEKGLQIAAHYDHAAAVQDCFSRMTALLDQQTDAEVATLQALESLLSRSFVTLRKMGMRDEIAFLLEAMTRLVRDSRQEADSDPERLRILLQLAGGWFYFSQDRGWKDIDDARQLLLSGRLMEEGHVGTKKQTELAIAYLSAVSQAPLDEAVDRINDLFCSLEGIRDGATVNSHYSLKQLDIVEALVQTIVSDSFTMDSHSQRWLDDEEFLIRRRIHRDMRNMMD